MHDDLFDKSGDDAVVLRAHVLPGAGRTAVVGTHGDALKIRIAAPPTGGRANTACAELLCEVFGVKSAQVELKGGESSRSKRFLISSVDPDDVSRLLDEAITAATTAPGRPRR